MGYGTGLGFGLGGWLGMLGALAMVVGLVVLIAWAIGHVSRSGTAQATARPQAAPPDSIEVLRLRFARGEITADEYVTAKQVLEAGR